MVVQLEGVFAKAAPCTAGVPIDLDRQVDVVSTVSPEVYELVHLVVHWPAASTLNMAVDSGISFMRKHMVLVLASDTVRSNVAT